jgi:hypothetical protein
MWIDEIRTVLLSILAGRATHTSDFVFGDWHYYVHFGVSHGDQLYFIVFKVGHGGLIPLYKYEAGRESVNNIDESRTAVLAHLAELAA